MKATQLAAIKMMLENINTGNLVVLAQRYSLSRLTNIMEFEEVQKLIDKSTDKIISMNYQPQRDTTFFIRYNNWYNSVTITGLQSHPEFLRNAYDIKALAEAMSKDEEAVRLLTKIFLTENMGKMFHHKAFGRGNRTAYDIAVLARVPEQTFTLTLRATEESTMVAVNKAISALKEAGITLAPCKANRDLLESLDPRN